MDEIAEGLFEALVDSADLTALAGAMEEYGEKSPSSLALLRSVPGFFKPVGRDGARGPLPRGALLDRQGGGEGMTILKFNDGVAIDTSGPYRVISEADGHYATGRGFLCPVDSRAAGDQMIADLNRVEEKARPFTCSICEREVREYGCNAQPVNDGRCCRECDNTVVVPARIELIRRRTAR